MPSKEPKSQRSRPDHSSKAFSASKDTLILGNNRCSAMPPDAISTPLVSSFHIGMDYRRETDRITSLQKWPAKDFIDIKATAKSGLYYYGEGDKVRCEFCRQVIYCWVEGDEPDALHSRFSASCPLILNCSIGNVPIARVSKCSISENISPKHPTFTTDESRIESFQNWPARTPQSPLALAQAGFYYIGIQDQTVCFHCGGYLNDWEDDDDPWEQHAIWLTGCVFLRHVKGEEFINDVLKVKSLLKKISVQSNQTDTFTRNDDTPNRKVKSLVATS